jgi:hypothetical protein
MGGFVPFYWSRVFHHLRDDYTTVMVREWILKEKDDLHSLAQVPLDTVGTSIHNASVIRKYVLRQSKPVIIIGHSKVRERERKRE